MQNTYCIFAVKMNIKTAYLHNIEHLINNVLMRNTKEVQFMRGARTVHCRDRDDRPIQPLTAPRPAK